MIIELHSDSEEAEYTAQLLAALVDIGKLPQFVDEVEHGPTREDWRNVAAWHAICRLEDDMLAFQQRNRWCGMVDGWEIVIGHADAPEDHPIPMVPEYVGWGPVQAWVEYNSGAVVTIDPGYGVHVWDKEFFEHETQCDVFTRAPFSGDSGILLNAAFRMTNEDKDWLHDIGIEG